MAPANGSESDGALALKEEGNLHFREGRLEEAISRYTAGLALASGKDARLVLLKNRAQCLLKLQRHSDAERDASEALSLEPGDVKALFRRAQAFEALGKPLESHKDLRRLLQIEPSNSAAAALLRKVEASSKRTADEQTSTIGRVRSMLRIIKEKLDIEDKDLVKAINNITSLCAEASSAAAVAVIELGGLPPIVSLCHHQSHDVISAALRCLSAIAVEDKEKSLVVLEALSSTAILRLASVPDPKVVICAGSVLKTLLVGLTQITKFITERDTYEAERKRRNFQMPPFRKYKMDADIEGIVDNILTSVVKLTNSYKVSVAGRDSLLQVVIGIVGRQDGINWSKKFLEVAHGVTRILEVGAAQYRPEDAETDADRPLETPGANVARLKVSPDSRMHAAVLLNRVFEDLTSDKLRDEMKEQCQAFIIDLLSDDMLDTKVEAMNTISTLLQGPFEVGISVIGREGILEGMLLLCQSDRVSHQRAALETIVLSCSKRDKCSGVIQQAVPILRDLYQSNETEIKVRALVGLCKLGSSGGTDPSARAMADGSSVNLSRSCRRMLLDSEAPKDTARWAVEGLAYLSLDAEVKEELAVDENALRRLMMLPKDCTHDVLYPLASIFTNVTNSYDKPDVLPEMKELAKFAKQHIPEEDPKDAAEFLIARIDRLVAAGIPSALFSLTTRSAELPTAGTRELLSRVFLAIAAEERHRGSLVQAGAGKALLTLATDETANSEPGRAIAAQALAKIGITMDPRLAFPGQRSMEVVRPFVQLLNLDRTALQNFEALLALTNIASLGDRHRDRIMKEKGFSSIEHYMFEDHEQLRRAATECMCNMVSCEAAQELYLQENDRVKMLVLFSAEYEDPGLMRAASGALGMLAHLPEICKKITKVNNWIEIIQTLAASDDPQLSHRGVHIIRCMMESDKSLAEYLVQTNTLEVLMALLTIQADGFAPTRQTAQEALDLAVEYGLITSTSEVKATNLHKKRAKAKESSAVVATIQEEGDEEEKEDEDVDEESNEEDEPVST